MSDPVVGSNSSGNGVSGTGSQYGVYGISTAAFAGVAGVTTTAAPGVYGQSKGIGPGVMAICGLGDLLDTILDGSVDSAATQIAGQYEGYAGIFIGNVAITGTLSGNSVTLTGALTADSIAATTSLTGASAAISGALTGDSANFSATVTANEVTANEVTVHANLTGNTANFSGNVTANDAAVHGNLSGNTANFSGVVTAHDVVVPGADCAEEFDLRGGLSIEPGSVVVFDEAGELCASARPYDKRVAGVISGAGCYRPGLVLDRRASSKGRAPVALVGKVYCKVDADPSPIAVGDMLTTSGRPGFGMKASDPSQAFGAVIGKALQPLRTGQGMIPILVALQ